MTEKEKLLRSLYRDGLIGPTVVRNIDIRDKINSLPGKLSGRVKIVAHDIGLSERQVYRVLEQQLKTESRASI